MAKNSPKHLTGYTVRHGAVDRAYLHQHLGGLKPKIESELSKLKGHGMEWIILDNDNEDPLVFEVDKEEPAAFCDFFTENDRDGRESYLRKYYQPDDVVLQTKDSICREILRIMKILLPLYNTMVWRPPLKSR